MEVNHGKRRQSNKNRARCAADQITILVEFRRRLGIDTETLLRMTVEDGELRVSPVRIVETERQRAMPILRDTIGSFGWT